MKYLISYFENSENEYTDFYGLYPEDIKEMFLDIQDEGYSVRVNFTKKLFQHNFESPLDKSDVKFGLVPYIEVKIKKNIFGFMTSDEINTELYRLTQSDIFKEIIQVANSRLKDLNWKIQDIKREHDYLSISIYKINI